MKNNIHNFHVSLRGHSRPVSQYGVNSGGNLLSVDPRFHGDDTIRVSPKIKIALISSENIGATMTGPAIRYFELAKCLCGIFEVTLFTPELDKTFSGYGFKIKKYHKSTLFSRCQNISKFEYVIAQNLTPNLLSMIKKHNIKYIADLYDPVIVEIKEHLKFLKPVSRFFAYGFFYSAFKMQVRAADWILYSNERQKELYQKTFKLDRDNFSELPFGLSKQDPVYTDKLMLENLFSISKDDKVILWGGGIWNWFDALSVVKAIYNISLERSDIKLVFMGMIKSNGTDLQDTNVKQVLAFCRETNILNKYVFFPDHWLPYSDRVNFLLRADICISTHFESEETYYSFRTRVLGYLWAEKPIVATEGDYFATIIKNNNLGKVVKYGDVDDIRDAIISLLANKEREVIINNIKKIKPNYYWDTLCQPLIQTIQSGTIRKNKPSFSLYFIFLQYYFWGFAKKMINSLKLL